VKFADGVLKPEFEHLPPFTMRGGHGMIFNVGEKIYLTYHSPNRTTFERPCFVEIVDEGDRIEVKSQI
jgi:hypothetical protein